MSDASVSCRLARVVARALIHLLEILQRARRVVQRGDRLGRGGERLAASASLSSRSLTIADDAREPEVLALPDGDIRLLRGAQLGDAERRGARDQR